jgi:methyltransferase-like protein/cyclopropane fatty-acyl-phospholipid synthase-like methyltransferase
MAAVDLTAYDEVAYPSYVYPQTHPDRLATIATLFGMNPPPVEACRVIELACGAGGNLIPMAFDLSGSTFLGIDLAGKAITEGQQTIDALGLKNISLQKIDLMAVSSDLGEFDYIIAHGLFSWVPRVVRDQILALCRKHLAPEGVAYISYNTYPGCRLREIARDIMRFHTKDAPAAAEKVGQGRAVIKWVVEAQQQTNSYATFLTEMNARLMKRDDGSIYHDELAEVNDPLYFHQFAEYASRHDLQFISEADYFEESADHSLSGEAARQLDQLGQENILAREQYLDFLKGRSFRQTLLCHREVKLSRPINPKSLKSLLIKSQAKPVSSAPDIKSRSAEEFRAKTGAAATTDQPLAKAAFLHLSRIYPRAISFDYLVTQARLLAGANETTVAEDSVTLAEVMLKTYEVGVVELHLHEPAYIIEPSTYPIASPIARLQIKSGNVVATLLHTSLRLEDPLAQKLLGLLDGTRDRAALVQELAVIIESTAKDTSAKKEPAADDLTTHLENKLAELGRLGLLLA